MVAAVYRVGHQPIELREVVLALGAEQLRERVQA